MPNQRAKNKVRLQGYIEKKLYRELARRAVKAAWTRGVFGYVIHLVEPLLGPSYKQARRKSSAPPKKKTARLF